MQMNDMIGIKQWVRIRIRIYQIKLCFIVYHSWLHIQSSFLNFTQIALSHILSSPRSESSKVRVKEWALRKLNIPCSSWREYQVKDSPHRRNRAIIITSQQIGWVGRGSMHRCMHRWRTPQAAAEHTYDTGSMGHKWMSAMKQKVGDGALWGTLDRAGAEATREKWCRGWDDASWGFSMTTSLSRSDILCGICMRPWLLGRGRLR